MSFPPPSHTPVPADSSAKTDGEAYFSCEAVPAEEDECERRRFLPRRAKRRTREKKLLSGTNARRICTRARIFGGPGDGDSEGKKEGIGWEKEHQGKKGQRLGRSDRIILMIQGTAILVPAVNKLA